MLETIAWHDLCPAPNRGSKPKPDFFLSAQFHLLSVTKRRCCID